MPAIRKGDVVKVISGKEKGKSGKVLEVLGAKGRVRVEKLMLVKKHLKKGRSQSNPQGGILEKEGTIAISNLMLVVEGKAVRREKMVRELGAREKARLEKRKAVK
jgi:large subunit ribosomal protein L24